MFVGIKISDLARKVTEIYTNVKNWVSDTYDSIKDWFLYEGGKYIVEAIIDGADFNTLLSTNISQEKLISLE